MPAASTIFNDFLEPVSLYQLSDDAGYKENQIGKHIDVYDETFPDLEKADIIFLGCGEYRGEQPDTTFIQAANTIRKEFYNMYQWHSHIQLADVGNIHNGATLQDTYAAVKAVLSELLHYKKKIILLGGSHDITYAQYEAHAQQQELIEIACIDARIDMNMDSLQAADFFLMPMLTSVPNFIKQYHHIGFQSYLVHPVMLETFDKLRLDCYRVGKVKENMEEMEPVIRQANLFSFDIAAIQNSSAPANYLTPNGFNGEEACMLMQYAGMSPKTSTIGIYGYWPEKDKHFLTAKQISHMLWYAIDGVSQLKQEASLDDRYYFNEFHLAFAEMDTLFLQSKKTGRWWMRLPDGSFLPCSYADYNTASQNEIPERWLRNMERN